MLWAIGAGLVFLWLISFVGHVGGWWIHLLLVLAAIVFVWTGLTGRRTI
jgi:hypothetical protein